MVDYTALGGYNQFAICTFQLLDEDALLTLYLQFFCAPMTTVTTPGSILGI
jgi:hypothetical protein